MAPAFSLLHLVTGTGTGWKKWDKKVLRVPISVSGVLGFEGVYPILCLERDHARYGIVDRCIELLFDWRALGIERSEAKRILRQWSGRWVEVQGPVRRRAKRSWSRFPATLDARYISLERSRTELHSASYCVGYRGPSRPSRIEEEDRLFGLGSGTCRDLGGFTSFAEGSGSACLEPYETVLWLSEKGCGERTWAVPTDEDRRLEFALPPPFAARDIRTFIPLSESVHLLNLMNGQLLSLVDGEIQALEEGLETDQLERPSWSEVAFYRARRPATESSGWNALRSIGTDLTPATLWESKEWTYSHISFGRRPLRILLRKGNETRSLQLDGRGGWEELAFE